MTKETDYIIPVEGSLALLALGDEGLVAWRKVRELHKKQSTVHNSQSTEQPAPNNQQRTTNN